MHDSEGRTETIEKAPAEIKKLNQALLTGGNGEFDRRYR